MDFRLPADAMDYQRILAPLAAFLEPNGAAVRPLDAELIRVLMARGELPSEAEARARRMQVRQGERADMPANPFGSVPVPYPPLLELALRRQEPTLPEAPPVAPVTETGGQNEAWQGPPAGVLVWQKVLPASDALSVQPGTHHVGGVRLTQARFENPAGRRIDQTTYFRQLFADYPWRREVGRHRANDQEHTFVPMRLIIRGRDHGIHRFEISHKPSGEAGQDNYTTILRWGQTLSGVIQQARLTGATLSLYEVADAEVEFLIEIV